jgi:hypothetical protein
MGQGDPGRRHQAAGMKSPLKIGKTFHTFRSAKMTAHGTKPSMRNVRFRAACGGKRTLSEPWLASWIYEYAL